MVPRLVAMVIARVPDAGRPVAGGVPVLLMYGSWVGSTGCHLHDTVSPTPAACACEPRSLQICTAPYPTATASTAKTTPATAGALRARCLGRSSISMPLLPDWAGAKFSTVTAGARGRGGVRRDRGPPGAGR